MKKLTFIVLTLILAGSSGISVMAQDIDTEAEIVAGGGNPPIIKCKWETPDDGDPENIVPFTQVLPSAVCDEEVLVNYWAVVTDPEGVDSVSRVYADVWHPQEPPEYGSFKYQLQLFRVILDDPIEDFIAAYNKELVTFSSSCDFYEVVHELEQGLAHVYCGEALLDYCQPAGDYLVEVYAYDTGNNRSEGLTNHFTYVAVTACMFDFESIDYGSVVVSVNKWIGGDQSMNTPRYPTVRNCGNTNARLSLSQDDMGLGMSSLGYNVEYDARLGANGCHAYYDPYQEVTLEDVLPLCSTQKLDFSIHVRKGQGGSYCGSLTIGCVYAPFAEE